MATKHELHHKDLKEPDAFFETIGQVNRYVRENRSLVIGVAAAVLTVFVGGVSWSSYQTRSADRNAAAFIRATVAIDDGALAAAKAGFTNVSDSSHEPYSAMARLYQAGLELQEDNFDAASAIYAAASKAGVPGYLRQTALVGQAYALERAGNAAEAAATYARAAELEGPQVEQALRGQLRAALAAGDNASAAAAAERILDKFPTSPDANELSARLAALSAETE